MYTFVVMTSHRSMEIFLIVSVLFVIISTYMHDRTAEKKINANKSVYGEENHLAVNITDERVKNISFFSLVNIY